MNWTLVLKAMLPEHLLLAGIVLALVAEMAAPRSRAAFACALASVLGALAAALWLWRTGVDAVPFAGHYSIAPPGAAQKAVLLALAVPALLIAYRDYVLGRHYALLLASLYGACLLVGADSLATLFLAIELLSLPVYALIVAGAVRPGSAEAALKYLVLGGAATATLLLGTSLLYGWSGSLAIATFATALGSSDPAALTGAMLLVAALYVKAAIVPFHAWAPDAYEGATVPVTAWMAALVKAAVLLAALRLFGAAQPGPAVLPLLAVLPLASMVWGNVAAIRQTGFRRTIAYSSIAHAGYLWFALLGAPAGRAGAVTFYLAVYGVTTLLAFAALPRSGGDDSLDSLRGLFRRRPAAAILIAAAMLSLAGIPPLPGFAAKFLVFGNVVAAGHTTYAVLGLVASYLGLYFYLRIVQFMFMATGPADEPARQDRAAWLAGIACAIPTLLLALFPGWLLDRL